MTTKVVALLVASVLVGVLWRIVGDALHISADKQIGATLATILIIGLLRFT